MLLGLAPLASHLAPETNKLIRLRYLAIVKRGERVVKRRVIERRAEPFCAFPLSNRGESSAYQVRQTLRALHVIEAARDAGNSSSHPPRKGELYLRPAYLQLKLIVKASGISFASCSSDTSAGPEHRGLLLHLDLHSVLKIAHSISSSPKHSLNPFTTTAFYSFLVWGSCSGLLLLLAVLPLIFFTSTSATSSLV